MFTRCSPECGGIFEKKSTGFGNTRAMASISPDFNFSNAVGLIDHHLLHVDAEPLEHDGAGQARPGAGGPEIDLLAAQVLQAMDVVARQNMKLRDRQPNDVLNAALKIAASYERCENIRTRRIE